MSSKPQVYEPDTLMDHIVEYFTVLLYKCGIPLETCDLVMNTILMTIICSWLLRIVYKVYKYRSSL